MRKNKIVSLLLIAVIFCSIFPIKASAAPLDLGEYFYAYIVLVKDWKHLCVSGKNVEIAAKNDVWDPAQIWRFYRNYDGSYSIRNVYWDDYYNQWNLDCKGRGSTKGTNVCVTKMDGASDPAWFIYDKGNNRMQLVPAHCDLALDAEGGSSAPGTNIQIWTQNNSDGQMFSVWKLDEDDRAYEEPGRPFASEYTGPKTGKANTAMTLKWRASPKVNGFDKRTYKITVKDESGNTVLSKSGLTGTSYKYTFKQAGKYRIQITAVNSYYRDKEYGGPISSIEISPGTTHGVSCPSSKYDDVNKDSGHWTHLPIDYVLQKGYMQGVSEREFAPDGTVTRAQIVQMLYAKEGKPTVSGARKFRDVGVGKWYANAVEWASTKGVVAGYSDGTFKPEQAVTREQLVTIMYAYARHQGKDLTPSGSLSGFSDAWRVSNYAKTPMQWAIGRKIISGTGNGLEPKGRSTRAQIAVILKAYDQKVK